MTALALIRHGPTSWNEEHRLQGQADIPLSADGRAKVSGWTVPQRLHNFHWVISPLCRAAETASLLGITGTTCSAIIEMHWGDWEGYTFEELRRRYGDEVRERAARGLDLRPHEGESPREVRERVRRWLARVAAAGRPTGAVTHQGVIRAVMSLATGWDMINPPPEKLDWASVHMFAVADDGAVEIAELNIGLEAP
jgi:probable phosphoglycerate mutase